MYISLCSILCDFSDLRDIYKREGGREGGGEGRGGEGRGRREGREGREEREGRGGGRRKEEEGGEKGQPKFRNQEHNQRVGRLSM